MRLASTKTAAILCGGLLLALSVPANAAVDAKLLDMLKANGQITNAQYSELQAELARDQKEQQIARQAPKVRRDGKPSRTQPTDDGRKNSRLVAPDALKTGVSIAIVYDGAVAK